MAILLLMYTCDVECFVPGPVVHVVASKSARSSPATARWEKNAESQQEPLPPVVEESSWTTTTNKGSTKLSLEAKMAKWEASQEEIQRATLGGLVPQQRRADSFDLGLYVAFPFMIIGCLLFLAFPFLVNNIDVSSVGPPPTI